jgi:hypothetical protein
MRINDLVRDLPAQDVRKYMCARYFDIDRFEPYGDRCEVITSRFLSECPEGTIAQLMSWLPIKKEDPSFHMSLM